MAVTQDQLRFINAAVDWLSPQGTERTTLGRDVAATIENLVTILNENNDPEAPDIEYDPAVGYTPELGAQLQAQLSEFKDSWAFTGLTVAERTGRADGLLQGEDYNYLGTMPVRADATKLIQLVQNGDQIIGALNAAHEDGQLSMDLPEPAPTPAPAPVEPAPEEPEPAPVVGETDPDDDTIVADGDDAPEPDPVVPPAGDDNPFGDTIEEVELSTDNAVRLVEEALIQLAPQLNERLDGVTGSFNGASAGTPQGGLLGLVGSFLGEDLTNDLLGAFLPNARITEITNADGVFDMRSQSALQGLMSVLSHPQVMGLQGENTYLYTPAKGQQIIAGLDDFKAKIKPFMSEDDFNALSAQLTPEIVSSLVEALDKLHAEGLISTELLIDPDGAAVEIPADIQRHFQERITMPTSEGALASIDMHGLRGASGLADQNPDMLRLMDEFTRGFTGRFGLAELMPDLEMPDLIADVDSALTPEQRLADFYSKARAAHGGTPEEFSSDLLVLLDTTMLLPFGEQEYRDAFRAGLYDAIVDAGNISDPQRAGEYFAGQVTQTMQSLRAEYGQPVYTRMVDIDVPRWRPGLADLEITSGGEVFDGAAIAKAYDDYNLSVADADNRRLGQSDEWYRQAFITFKDDNGQVYVALEDDETRMFTVEPVNGAALAEIYYDTSVSLEERLEKMRDIDPAFALLVNENGHIEMGAFSYDELVRSLTSGAHYDLSEFAAGYGRMADATYEENARLDAEEAARDTQIQVSDTAAGDVDHTVPELPDHITGDTLMELREYVRLNNLPADPMLIHAGDSNIGLLQDHAGYGLAIGTKPQHAMPDGADLRIGMVRMQDEPQAGRPMIAYYDERYNDVRVIAVPDVVLDHNARAELLAETRDGPDSLEFMKRIQTDHPDLFNMIQAYRTGDAEARTGGAEGLEGHKRLHNEPLTMTDYWGFKRDLRHMLSKLEDDLGGRTYPTQDASEVRRAFSDGANAGPEQAAPRDPVDEMRVAASEITGDAPQTPDTRVVAPADDYTNDM